MKVKIGKYPRKSDKERKISVCIDPQDTWSMYETLAHIIVPMLKQLKTTKHGSPFVDDIDVPDELKSTAAPPKEHEWDTDDNHHKRWEWALSEMIWAFEQHLIDWDQQYFHGNFDLTIDNEGLLTDGPNHTATIDREGMQKHSDRMRNGRILFAKYYDCLWD